MEQTGLFRRGSFTVTTDPASFDIDAIHAYLTRSYWSPGIPRAVVERAIANSLSFGLFHGANQIGFARVITDRATYGYLADVYILEEFRGQGLATWLIECVCSHADLQGLRRFALATRDAHSLYRKFGFGEISDPSKHMEIFRPGVYEI
jgi:N-acetylglutamate synthase-like GNAT family acetyltransferase